MYFYTNNTARMIIGAAGNVGIGTTAPSSTLEVNGNIELAGSLQAPGAPQPARMLWGNINTAGAIGTGGSGGYTVQKLAGTGRYRVTFTTAFPSVPSVTASAGDPSSGDDNVAVVNFISATSFDVYTWDTGAGTNTPEDSWFSFQVIGRR